MKKKLQDMIEQLLMGDESVEESAARLDEDLKGIASCVNAIDQLEEKRRKQIQEKASRHLGYAISRIQQENIQTDSELDEAGEPDYTPGLLAAASNAFWGWVILKFSLLEDRDQVLSADRKSYKPLFTFQDVFPLIAIIVGVFAVVYILREDPDNLPDGPQSYIAEATKNKPRLLNYTDEVQISMSKTTSFTRLASTQIKLKKGSIWLDVQRGGEGFIVDTQFGQVKVTGTSFAVTMQDSHAVIEVVEGRVVIEREGQTLELLPGQKLIADSIGFSNVEQRDEGTKKPMWVKSLQQSEWSDRHPSLVAYWNMDEISPEKQLLDFGKNQLHALQARSGQPAASQIESLSLFNKAAKFNDLNKNFYRIRNAEAMREIQNDNFTIMAWVKRSKSQNAEKKTEDAHEKFLSCLKGGFRFGFIDENLTLTDTSGNHYRSKVVPYDRWAHVACVFTSESKSLTFYINGEFASNTLLLQDLKPAMLNWNLGAGGLDTAKGMAKPKLNKTFYNGLLDELRVYSEAMSEEEIKQVSKINLIDPVELDPSIE